MFAGTAQQLGGQPTFNPLPSQGVIDFYNNNPVAGMGPEVVLGQTPSQISGVPQPTSNNVTGTQQPAPTAFQLPPLPQTTTQQFNSPSAQWLGGTMAPAYNMAMGAAQNQQSVLNNPGFSQWLSQLQTPGQGGQYLGQIAQGGGNPFNVTPAWEAMIAAQQRNLGQNFANLNEAFNVSGGRFSSPFGQAAADYWEQAGRDQNSLLAQMNLTAHEAAQNRLLGASQGLFSGDLATRQSAFNAQVGAAESALGRQSQMQQLLASGALNSGQFLAGQDFNNFLNSSNQSFNAAQNQAQMAYGAGNALQQAGVTGATGLYQGVLGAMNNLYNTENQAATNLFGSQQQSLQNQTIAALQAQGLSIQQATTLAQQLMQQSQLGSQLGGQQYGVQQNEIDRMYQEWLRTQPYYNPLLPYMWQGATATQPQAYPGYTPNTTGQSMSSMIQALMQLLPYLGIRP
jgi:hypothetical protein